MLDFGVSRREDASDLGVSLQQVARVLLSGDTKIEHPGATSRSDLPRSPSARATSPERLSQVAPARATSSSRSRFDGARHEESVGSDLLGATMLGRSACLIGRFLCYFRGLLVICFIVFRWQKPKLSTLGSHQADWIFGSIEKYTKTLLRSSSLGF